ncbi:helix-turn-helix domain-containing protein [Leucobacter japonicus]|uniref:helix-turn-helix domain-containing protein n=1 Tax=Leucobacter japonicus TaxID=1461259 RepID=UPI0006A760B9|nr:helix-turn-helix domain-containing protein [Leucobacter japonicus]
MSSIITGTALRQQREAAGLDTREVAELTGLPEPFIQLLESERRSAPQYIHRAAAAIAAHVSERTNA